MLRMVHRIRANGRPSARCSISTRGRLRCRLMRQALTGLVACIVLGGAAAPPQERVAALKRGVLLYAMPELPDPNFAQTVVLLLEHGSDGSLGVVLNRPTARSVDDALDVRAGTSGIDLYVSWGGPVQPEAVLSL